MKRSGENSLLDGHLKEKLGAADFPPPLIEWSELEVLLGAENKPISIDINRKQVAIAVIVIASCLGVWGIFKTVSYFTTRPDENSNVIDTLQANSINAIEPEKQVVIAPVVPAADTTRLDSTELLEHKTDSVLSASDSFLKKIKEAQTASVDPTVPPPIDKMKKQKKNKDIPIDSSAVTTPVEELPLTDTSHHKNIETKVIPSPDTTSAAPKNGKTKKGKNKKNTEPASEPLLAKPDSLK